MQINLDLNSPMDYARFLRVKSMPRYRFQGRTAIFPDEYSHFLGIQPTHTNGFDYQPPDFLFDYQRDITRLALHKKKFAIFVKMGYGKSLIEFEFARHAQRKIGKKRNTLILTPLMVVPQMIEEYQRFYGEDLEFIPARNLQTWLKTGKGIGLSNWEALHDELRSDRLGSLIADESGLMKSSYGKWGQAVIRMGKGLEYKLAGSGTPAPNDRTEFANHALFLDRVPTVNAFYAKYFFNKGQSANRWLMKPHAVEAFYRDMADWSIFLQNPQTYGWQDNVGKIPPVYTEIHNVPLTEAQRKLISQLCGGFFVSVGGIASRGKLARLAKGNYNGQRIATNKPEYIRKLVESWPEESTIIWTKYNDEQDVMEETFPNALSMRGSTPHAKRQEMLQEFKSGRNKVLISKGEIIGLGLNLQVCTRMVFNTCHDSAEDYLQCIGRGNRVGSTKPLRVHIPITDLERPMMENVLVKITRIQKDEAEQERVFKQVGFDFLNLGMKHVG